MEPVKEYTNVTFDEIQIGASAEITVTLTQSQIDLAAMVSGDVDAFYLMQPGDADKRQEAKKTEAAGAEAIISILLGTRLPGPGTKILHRDLHFAGDFAVGDKLTAKVIVREKRKEGNLVVFDTRCVNPAGKELVSGTVTVGAPTSRLVYDNIKPPKFELRWGDAFAQLIKGCQGCEPVSCAIVHPCDRDSLMGAIEAARRGFIIPVLVGPEDKIRKAAEEAKIDLGPYRIVTAAHSHESAQKAVALASSGEVESLMKGSLHTDEIMGAIVPTAAGLRTSRRISHAFVMDVATYPKMFIMTDAAVNIFPDLEVKRDIVQNAIDLAHALGIELPKVGILSAVEVINPKIPSTAGGGRPLQDGRPRTDYRRHPRRSPGIRQRHQRPGCENQGDRLARQRRRGHPAGAGSRGGQHALQAIDLPFRGRRSRYRARHPDPRRSHEPCRLDTDAARLGGRHGTSRPRPAKRKIRDEVSALDPCQRPTHVS